ncbi:MAG TPA: serine/threonine-protein kinase [Solirubrobacteraceae bacterium]|nr:serine/threonine-protein kinase [Solirubrobacteraceae bacterium]
MRPLGRGREIVPGTTILEHLHRSAGLDVYDAWNEPRGCRVIVKTPRPDRLHRPGARARLLREGRLLKRLTHPHIVRAYEVCGGARPVIVMETLTGATVEHLITHARRPLSARELANLGAHLAGALRHLHARGILHLDLKPSNVVAEHGRAKLIDLSHARPPGRMRAGNGTWCYMAPEQARGGEIGPAADIWGLGIVLYAAALRANPLADIADELDVDEPQLHTRLPLLRQARPRLPAELSTLIDACLEPRPDHRPELDHALRRLYAHS